MKPVLVDTGPLVAFLVRRDTHHAWAVDHFAAIRAPMLTCESVLSETAFILRRLGADAEPVLALMERRVVEVRFDAHVHRETIVRLMRKYADTPMSFVDACLVCMAETHRTASVLTLDSDFKHYRRLDRTRIPLLR